MIVCYRKATIRNSPDIVRKIDIYNQQEQDHVFRCIQEWHRFYRYRLQR